jgi:hypothetical protein
MARAKRLEWEEYVITGFIAETAAGDYIITFDDGGWDLVLNDRFSAIGRFATSDAAKAAGQAHFDALVASLIEEEPGTAITPQPDWLWHDKAEDRWVPFAERSPPFRVSVAIRSPGCVVSGGSNEWHDPPTRKI